MKNQKSIQSFSDKLRNTTSEIEKLVYTEAISLLQNDDMNYQKVENWVSSVLSSFSNKPKPLSQREKDKRVEKVIRKQEKHSELVSLNNKMLDLLNEHGVLFIGFFDWKALSLFEYEEMEKFVNVKGYHIKDFGDGAIFSFISTKEISDDFFDKYQDLEERLNHISGNNILDKYLTMDLDVFRSKVYEL